MMTNEQVANGESKNEEEWPSLSKSGETWELVETTWGQEREMVIVERPRRLSHCVSSPDMRHMDPLEAVAEEIDDSFSVISAGGSVCSSSSTTSAVSRVSFKDAFLSSPMKEVKEDVVEAPKSAPRSRVKPRYVVTAPLHRCAKSTGDLQALSRIQEHDDDEGGCYGAADDTEDYYHRKALGAKGRSNGLKMRPDEAKRKQHTLMKKSLQRARCN